MARKQCWRLNKICTERSNNRTQKICLKTERHWVKDVIDPCPFDVAEFGEAEAQRIILKKREPQKVHNRLMKNLRSMVRAIQEM